MMIMDICAVVIAAAFVALTAFLIVTLRSVSALLSQTHTAIQEMRHEMKGIAKDASDVLRHTNAVTADVLHKLHALEPAFDSVKQVGEAAEEITSTVKQASAAVARTVQYKAEAEDGLSAAASGKLAIALKAVPVLIQLWRQLKPKQTQTEVRHVS
ncbi:DUF948 domain-containing protein [Paenibacillus piri]|uniref:DUF948 domain-containing protein n=1 Tax=Paenibacillus piri TaxID=2547395 RepID=A0A4R5KJ40_9BACL|nr:DUF948 domain-containing protein [Paenibacillus piri]TDF95513.1 DUF948 domain-containing protein [Paenibacillus piri]